jgi:hypothetical protein
MLGVTDRINLKRLGDDIEACCRYCQKSDKAKSNIIKRRVKAFENARWRKCHRGLLPAGRCRPPHPRSLAGSPAMGDNRLNGGTRPSASTIMPIDLPASSKFSKQLPQCKDDL